MRARALHSAERLTDGSERPGDEAEPSGGEPMTLRAERTLVEAAKRDPLQFAALYEDNFERVYAFIARRVGDRDVTEDLTSDVFLQALANFSRFEWRGVPFAAWLFRIATNAIIDRSKRVAREQGSAKAESRVDEVFEAMSGGIEEGMEEIEQRARLFRLIDRLPPDQRHVIVMRFTEEKTIREVAEELRRTEGAVKQLQFRALRNLRTYLNENLSEWIG
ncbi:MAG TPA: sigma-70 family RNA polymerase sigma factor [Blastocatellia bacterium]|nr:sigma-70 family RNA polymerase sigma factor [Blastocatellia bacterium]